MTDRDPEEPFPAWMYRLKRNAEDLTAFRHKLAGKGSYTPGDNRVRDLMCEIERSRAFQEISRRIIDATSLAEAVHWHEKIIEELDLEILALHACDEEASIYTISALRIVRRTHQLTVGHLEELVRQGRAMAWSWRE